MITRWNTRLRDFVTQFASTRPDVTTLVYSSFELFSRILDKPEVYGFPSSDCRLMGGKIWYDHIHPTTRVHQEIGRDIAAFLHKHSSSETPGDVSEAN